MADNPGQSRRGLWIAILVAIIAVVLFAWAIGAFEDLESVWRADVTERGGGEIIVTDPTPGAVDVDLPDTPITPVVPETGAPAEEAPPQ